MGDDLERFVASLAIPADRKTVVLAELSDHLASATEAAARSGLGPAEAAAAGRAALGDLEALRRSIEAIEPAFQVSWGRAVLHGLAASVGVFVAYELAGVSLLEQLAAIAIVALLAPPRALALLRAEFRAARVRGSLGLGGVPIGPIAVYALLVMCVPILFGIVELVTRAYLGLPFLDIPLVGYAVQTTVLVVLGVEAVRARRTAVA